MSKKRRDNKGRILREGESQRLDGRYVFKYYDKLGRQHFIYSWKLEPTDSLPSGKRNILSLREREKNILKDLEDGINSIASNITVFELVQRYTSQRKGVRHNTKVGYNFILNIISKDIFGTRLINSIKLSDAKIWFIKMQEKGRSYNTISAIRGVMRPAFQMAVDDDILRKNPFDFELSKVIKNDSKNRQAITPEQEYRFLEFIRKDKYFCKYYEAVYILFKTGLRISEFVGLTINDIDLKNKVLTVDHQLQRKRDMTYIIEKTKTTSGLRKIPLTQDVCKAFKDIIVKRRKPKIEPMIDGKVGFLFLDRKCMPTVSLHWEKYFKRIWEKYNETNKDKLPIITPHICRHTFCSNMVRAGINPKVVQYIMGHSDISVTLNTYTHLNFNDAKNEIERIGKII